MSSLTRPLEAVPQDGCAGGRSWPIPRGHGERDRCVGQLRFMEPLGFGAASPDMLIYLCLQRPVLAVSAWHRAWGGRLWFPLGCPTPGWHRCQRRRQAQQRQRIPSLCLGSGGVPVPVWFGLFA